MTNYKQFKKELLRKGQLFNGYKHRRHRNKKKPVNAGIKKQIIEDIEQKESQAEIEKIKN